MDEAKESDGPAVEEAKGNQGEPFEETKANGPAEAEAVKNAAAPVTSVANKSASAGSA